MYHTFWLYLVIYHRIYHFCYISPVSGRSLIPVAYARIPTTRWCWQPKTADRGHQDIQWQVGQSGARRCCSFFVFLHRKYKNEFKKNNSRLNQCFLLVNPKIKSLHPNLFNKNLAFTSATSPFFIFLTQNGAFFPAYLGMGWLVPPCSTFPSLFFLGKVWKFFLHESYQLVVKLDSRGTPLRIPVPSKRRS